MEKNVGNFEAVIRGVIGAGTLALAVGRRNPLWLAMSLLHFGTAVGRYCPINAIFNIERTPEEEEGRRLRSVPTVH